MLSQEFAEPRDTLKPRDNQSSFNQFRLLIQTFWNEARCTVKTSFITMNVAWCKVLGSWPSMSQSTITKPTCRRMENLSSRKAHNQTWATSTLTVVQQRHRNKLCAIKYSKHSACYVVT